MLCYINIYIIYSNSIYQRRFCNNNDNISQQTLECFIEAIVEDPKIDIIKEIIQEIGEVGDIQHRIILRYNNEFIPVIKNIIEDFNLTNNIKS